MKIKTKLKKGDKVKVMAGKDKGREGTVGKIFPKTGKILVGGVNIYKKHSRPRDGSKNPGGIIDVVRPLPWSNVALICPKCSRPTRIGVKEVGQEKVRICKKCKEVISK